METGGDLLQTVMLILKSLFPEQHVAHVICVAQWLSASSFFFFLCSIAKEKKRIVIKHLIDLLDAILTANHIWWDLVPLAK